jgi:MOSC domain-containing protein YiiM
MVKRFLASRRSGFYFAVKKEGFTQTGDSIELLSRDPSRVSVTDIVRVYAFEREDMETIRRAMSVEALPESWREYFQQQLEKPSG